MNLEMFRSVLDKFETASDSKTVYGDPIQVDGKTVVPVASVAYGIGMPKPSLGMGESATPEAGLGGIFANPVGVLEVSGDETRFVPINDTKRVLGILALGIGIGFMLGSRRRTI